MCNRYSKAEERLRVQSRLFGIVAFELAKRYNIAPTQDAPVLLVENDKLVHRDLRWGWQTKVGVVTNAQAETAQQKMWKHAWESGRCIVPADGFYEWTKEKPAQPYRIARATGHSFFFAGLFDNGCFAILTAPASTYIRHLHNRQPIILRESAIDWWLGPGDTHERNGWAVIAREVPSTTLTAYKVTPEMTNPRFESPHAIEPFQPAQESFLRHSIEADEWRWRELEETPTPDSFVWLLIDDETVDKGQWDGERWKSARGASPLKWRPITRNQIGYAEKSP